MSESHVLIARLRANDGAVRRNTPLSANAWFTEGLTRAQLHEVYAVSSHDGACAAGFATALMLAAGALPVLWLRTEAADRNIGRLHATGLLELGLKPDTLLLGVVGNEGALLRAASDGARCAGLGTLVVEVWGSARALDLTVTRRLMLAAETSGVTVLLLRVGTEPVPSAAATRWSVAPSPSTPLEAGAPGNPTFLIELQRRRGGPAGQRWRVEWNRDAYRFEPLPSEDQAALPGAGLPLATGGAAAEHTPAPLRRA